MAREINSRIGNTPLTVVCIMTGSIILVADLIRNFQMPVRLGILSASSYRGNMIRDQLTLDTQMLPSITDQHVLIVDDIFDTGHTLSEVTQHIQSLGPATIHTAVLLRKAVVRRLNLMWILLDLKYRTNLWLDMGWIIKIYTAICHL